MRMQQDVCIAKNDCFQTGAQESINLKNFIKGIVHLKMKILSSFTLPSCWYMLIYVFINCWPSEMRLVCAVSHQRNSKRKTKLCLANREVTIETAAIGGNLGELQINLRPQSSHTLNPPLSSLLSFPPHLILFLLLWTWTVQQQLHEGLIYCRSEAAECGQFHALLTPRELWKCEGCDRELSRARLAPALMGKQMLTFVIYRTRFPKVSCAINLMFFCVKLQSPNVNLLPRVKTSYSHTF